MDCNTRCMFLPFPLHFTSLPLALHGLLERVLVHRALRGSRKTTRDASCASRAARLAQNDARCIARCAARATRRATDGAGVARNPNVRATADGVRKCSNPTWSARLASPLAFDLRGRRRVRRRRRDGIIRGRRARARTGPSPRMRPSLRVRRRARDSPSLTPRGVPPCHTLRRPWTSPGDLTSPGHMAQGSVSPKHD
jgi:hypothetical protein